MKYFIADKSTVGYFIPKDEKAKVEDVKVQIHTMSGKCLTVFQDEQVEKAVENLKIEESKEEEKPPAQSSQVPDNKKFAEKVIDVTPLDGIRYFLDYSFKYMKLNRFRLLVLPTQIKDVVTLAGSMLGGDYYSLASNPMVSIYH